MQRFGLRDDQWERIKDFLPGREGHVGGNVADNRLFVEAVLYREQSPLLIEEHASNLNWYCCFLLVSIEAPKARPGSPARRAFFCLCLPIRDHCSGS